jgi:hypothetical protein
MKKLFAIMVVLATIASCQININGGKAVVCEGPVVEKEMEGLTGYEGITVNGSIDLYFSQASTYSVSVKANEEVYD